MTTLIQQPNTASESVEDLLERLCDLFAEETERQENVLAICGSQGEAARAHDHEYLENLTQSLVVLLDDAAKAQHARIEVLDKVVKQLNLAPQQQSLSHLIQVAPEPWRRLLSEFQTGIKGTLEATKAVVRANASLMRRHLRSIDQSLYVVLGDDASKPNLYNPEGKEHKERQADAALIDTQG